jgi:DNA-binding NarL/FixJ family response regulator
MKILQADDHPLFREGIRYLLEQLDAKIELLEAGTVQAAVEILGKQQDIDLILLDLAMPGMNGFAGFHAIEECNPAIPLVVLSASENPRDIQKAMKAGAAGYIPKSSTSETMINALKLVLKGGIYTPEIFYQLATSTEISPIFTESQRKVLAFMVEGLSNKQIARNLYIAESTVKHHVGEILKLLAVSNRTQAALKAKEMVIYW